MNLGYEGAELGEELLRVDGGRSRVPHEVGLVNDPAHIHRVGVGEKILYTQTHTHNGGSV